MSLLKRILGFQDLKFMILGRLPYKRGQLMYFWSWGSGRMELYFIIRRESLLLYFWSQLLGGRVNVLFPKHNLDCNWLIFEFCFISVLLSIYSIINNKHISYLMSSNRGPNKGPNKPNFNKNFNKTNSNNIPNP